MFRVAIDELRAWWWLIRCKVASTCGLIARVCGDRVLDRLTRGKSAPIALVAAVVFLALAKLTAPATITTAAEDLTRKKFGG